MAYESPLHPDDPMALYRVHCPTCRNNVWASNEPPPSQGEEIRAEHDCPGWDEEAAAATVRPPTRMVTVPVERDGAMDTAVPPPPPGW